MSRSLNSIINLLIRPLGRITLCAVASPCCCLFSSGGGEQEPFRDWCLPKDTDRVVIQDSASIQGVCRLRVVATWPDDPTARELTCSSSADQRCDCAVSGDGWTHPGAVPSHLLVTDSETGTLLHDGPALYEASCRASAVAQRRTP